MWVDGTIAGLLRWRIAEVWMGMTGQRRWVHAAAAEMRFEVIASEAMGQQMHAMRWLQVYRRLRGWGGLSPKADAKNVGRLCQQWDWVHMEAPVNLEHGTCCMRRDMVVG